MQYNFCQVVVQLFWPTSGQVATSRYFWGNDCNVLLYLTTKHVFEIFGGQLPSCPLAKVHFLKNLHHNRKQTYRLPLR